MRSAEMVSNLLPRRQGHISAYFDSAWQKKLKRLSLLTTLLVANGTKKSMLPLMLAPETHLTSDADMSGARKNVRKEMKPLSLRFVCVPCSVLV
jgi:hypothetical protein